MKKNWFFLALIGVCGLTLGDGTETVAGAGKWLKSHGGADLMILLIFFTSGLILQVEEVRAAFGELRATLTTLGIIFVGAPALACLIALLPLQRGIQIGLLLVAMMPTTMSSGVVMTAAAGGNRAHSLLITVAANGLSVFTVPLSLGLLFGVADTGMIDRGRLMVQLGLLVLLPLFIGLLLRPWCKGAAILTKAIPDFNQSLVVAVVWMGLSDARGTILHGGAQVIVVILVTFLFHALLVGVTFGAVTLLGLGPGRRESVIFMAGQKTLPLSVLIQTKLFPQEGLALAFCVIHHFVHLVMDGYLVGRLKTAGYRGPSGETVAGKG